MINARKHCCSVIKADNGDYIMSDFSIMGPTNRHDGVLLEVKTTFKEFRSNMTLFIGIYKSENIRERMIVEFSDVDGLVFAMDSVELIDDHKSGSINNGYIKKLKGRRIYKFFPCLSDGLLSMIFENLQLIRPLE